MQRGQVVVIIASTLAALVAVFAITWALGYMADMGGHAIAALALGIVVSTAVGVGLMTLVFASSRERDEIVYRPLRDEDADRKDE